ncbi:MAG: cyclic nucleotide-binding domain-containing protein [Sulfurisoma sp.]|nr:cyclic nucleotide-binding domain-containing protein [Sulfurisoma sp.]
MKKKSAAAPQAADVPSVPAIAGAVPTPRHVPAGSTLLHRGDKSFGIFFLATGKRRLQRLTPDGGTVTLHMARPGEFFAEASPFADAYHCDARTETECEVEGRADAAPARRSGKPVGLRRRTGAPAGRCRVLSRGVLSPPVPPSAHGIARRAP